MYGPLIFIRCCACIFRLFRKNTHTHKKKRDYSLTNVSAAGSTSELMATNFCSFYQDVSKNSRTSAPVLDVELSPCCNYVFSLVKKLPVSTGFLVTSAGLHSTSLIMHYCLFHGAMCGIKHRHLTRGN